MAQQRIQKIAVIGNAGGGKTTLSRRLAEIHDLPLSHVDSIQFLPGMKVRPNKESIQILNEIQSQTAWIIDGYGPLDILEKRFALADRILLVDFPLWRHYWWCSKRQVKNLWSKRAELPQDFSEATWQQTMKLYQSLWRMHWKMRPELLRILARENVREKVVFIRSQKEWKLLFKRGLSVSEA